MTSRVCGATFSSRRAAPEQFHESGFVGQRLWSFFPLTPIPPDSSGTGTGTGTGRTLATPTPAPAPTSNLHQHHPIHQQHSPPPPPPQPIPSSSSTSTSPFNHLQLPHPHPPPVPTTFSSSPSQHHVSLSSAQPSFWRTLTNKWPLPIDPTRRLRRGGRRGSSHHLHHHHLHRHPHQPSSPPPPHPHSHSLPLPLHQRSASSMSFNPSARRAPNVSQYIANLNTVVPDGAPDDYAGQSATSAVDGDLAVFTNAEFFDFDMSGDHGAPLDFGSGATDRPDADGMKFDGQNYAYPNPLFIDTAVGASNPSVNPTSPVQAYPPFSGPYPYPPGGAAAAASSAPTTIAPASATLPSNRTPPQPVPALPAGAAAAAASRTTLSSTTTGSASSPLSAGGLTSPTASAVHLEASSRAAAEEDKRRRNTAASARFRIKKKQREQALEQTAREAAARADRLESRVGELERENKWLRGLLVEKAALAGGAGAGANGAAAPAAGGASAEEALKKLARDEQGERSEPAAAGEEVKPEA